MSVCVFRQRGTGFCIAEVLRVQDESATGKYSTWPFITLFDFYFFLDSGFLVFVLFLTEVLTCNIRLVSGVQHDDWIFALILQ